MPSLKTIAVYLGLALLLTHFHGVSVNWAERSHKRLERHARILDRQGDAPWGYRLAVPFAAEGLRRLQNGPLPETLPKAKSKRSRALSVPLERAYLGLRFAFTAGLLVFFHGWLRRFVGETEARAGTLLLAALHGPSYAYYWFQPASALDFLCWTAAAFALHRGRDVAVPAVLALAALNRETSVFIVGIYAAMRIGTVPVGALVLRCAGLLGIWAALQVGIRTWVGPLGWAGNGSTPVDYLRANLTNPDWIAYASAFFGILWAAPLLAWKRLPRELKWLAAVLVPYVGLQLLFGRIREVRLFLPLALVLIPAGWLWLREPGGPEAREPAG